jgi:hypothetical protein
MVNNKAIEQPTFQETTRACLIDDLNTIKDQAEMRQELHSLSNTPEFVQQQEIIRFLDDITPLKDKLAEPYASQVPWTFESFEFMLGRLVLLPLLVKTMHTVKSPASWIIDIQKYTQALQALPWSTPSWIAQSYTATLWNGLPGTQILTTLLTDQGALMTWRTENRMPEVTRHIKEASISYAEQYNTLVEWTNTTAQGEDTFAGQLKESYKNWTLSFDTIAEIRAQSNPKEKRKAAWLWLWLLFGWAYMLFKKRDKRKGVSDNIRWAVKDITGASWIWAFWWFITMAVMKAFEKKTLTFEEALEYVDNQVMHNISEKSIRTWFTNVRYDAIDWSIVSYNNKKTLIDKNTKKLVWFNSVTFTSYESLIHAANIVNYLKENLAYSSKEEQPFGLDEFTGNIVMKGATWKSQTVISWWRFSTLRSICPEINDTQNIRILFCSYLNKLWCWKQRDQQDRFDDDKTVYWDALRTMLDTIEKRTEWIKEWWNRKLWYRIIEASATKDVVAIRSRDKETRLIIKKSSDWSYQSISFDGYGDQYYLSATDSNLWFKHRTNEDLLLEWCMHANLFNRLAKQQHNKWKTESPYNLSQDPIHWKPSIYFLANTRALMPNHKMLARNTHNDKLYPTLAQHLDSLKWKTHTHTSPLITLLNTMYQHNQSNPHFSNNNQV